MLVFMESLLLIVRITLMNRNSLHQLLSFIGLFLSLPKIYLRHVRILYSVKQISSSSLMDWELFISPASHKTFKLNLYKAIHSFYLLTLVSNALLLFILLILIEEYTFFENFSRSYLLMCINLTLNVMDEELFHLCSYFTLEFLSKSLYPSLHDLIMTQN